MELLLEKDELLDLGQMESEIRIYCREGCCWLTVEGDNRDHVLSSGGNCAVNQRGRMIVTALAPTRLQLVTSAQARPDFKRLYKKHAWI